MGAAILVTAVIFGSAGVADRSTSRAQQTATAGSRLLPFAPLGTSPVPSATTQPTTSPTASRRPTVELRWTAGQSWVRVTDHTGAVRINDIYPKGTVKQFTGPSFHLELGNAGAITLIDQDGKQIVAGKAGQTVECKMGQTAKCTVTGGPLGTTGNS